MAIGQIVSSQGALLVDQLVQAGIVDAVYGRALKERYKQPDQIAQFLLAQNKVKEEEIAKAMAVVLKIPFIHLKGRTLDHSVVSTIPEQTARAFNTVAFETNSTGVSVAVARPYTLSPALQNALKEIETKRGVKILLSATTTDDVAWAFQAYTPSQTPAQSPAQTNQTPASPVAVPPTPTPQPPPQPVSAPRSAPPVATAQPNHMPTQGHGEKIIDELLRLGKIESSEVAGLRDPSKTIEDLVNELFKKKKITDAECAPLLARVYDLPFITLTPAMIDPLTLRMLPEQTARGLFALPYQKTDTALLFAISKPYLMTQVSSGPLHALTGQLGRELHLYVTTNDAIEQALGLYKNIGSLQNINLQQVSIPQMLLHKFPKDISQKYQMVVFGADGASKLKVAAVRPFDPQTKQIVDFIEKRNGISIDLYATTPQSFTSVLAAYDNPQGYIRSDGKTQEASSKIVEIDSLPSGQSPDYGGQTAENIPVVGTKEVIAVQSGMLSQGGIQKDGDNLEERNLDVFLGHEISDTQELVSIVKSGFVPKMVGAILSFGVYLRASDIHLEPMRNVFRIRYRVDGDLKEYMYVPLILHPPISSRIKILSNLKIDEQRVPQDGRYDAVAGGHEFDVRVSSLPTVYGEKIVMRLLDKSSALRTLDEMGVTGSNKDRLENELKKPWGVVMSTGPTGSGKSTTLYAILNQIATPGVNVITLEDPVEYEMKGVNQVQVKPKIGFTFAEGLRSILRQDPNVIMVGEIRDGETAELATHAALTGHLVLTTLHTNDAAGALPRLINMGVEPYLITSAVNAIVAQRLVRKLCQTCKEKATVPQKILDQVTEIMSDAPGFDSATPLQFYGPHEAGCDNCKHGYKGRTGIYEVLVMSDAIEEAAIAHKPSSEIDAIARKEGMISLQQDGITKALQGITTLDEIFKVTSDD